MNEVYNKAYYQQYDVGIEKVNYEASAYTETFLTQVADRIAEDLAPKTVLDAGCAMGYLVAALRDRGVEAYGIDISEYAISKVREDIRPYCVVGSLTNPLPESLPQRYDLVVTIEVLEHLYEDEGKRAIRNLCTLADRIIFCSTPDDFRERTHYNVQQREYWARLFAAEGFFDDLNYRPTYLTAYASCFRKSADWLRQLEDYERNIRMSEAEWQKAIDDKERHIQNLTDIQSTAEEKWRGQAAQYESSIEELKQLREQFQQELAQEQKRSVQELAQVQEQNTQELEKCQRQYALKFVEIQEQSALQRENDQAQYASELAHAEEQAKQKLLETQELARLELMQARAQFTQEIERMREASLQELGQLNAKYSAVFSMMVKARKEYRLLKEDMDCSRISMNEEKNRLELELAHYKEHYFAAINQREELKGQLAQVQSAYNVISNAFFWKITKPCRAALDGVKGLLRSNQYTRLCCKALKCWKENGTQYTWKKVEDKLHHRQDFTKAIRPLFTQEELERQKKDVFSKKVKFSILVPLYNTPEQFLHEMIKSVLDQTYADWELCMADGSDREHWYVERICRHYARRDSRIQYRKLERNLGISENTNACIDMASGDYIALFDHDDLLHPAALYEVMRAICEQDADFIYTDENTFHYKPEDAYCPHFKPDFAPDTLRSYNYICHLSVFQHGLLDRVGRFRSEFDGSQDYDMILRLTECAACIVHIPQILYYWRAHQDSVAEKVEAKPYTLSAARRALTEHLERVGLKGKVLDSNVPSTYRIVYELMDSPLISIIIPNMDHVETLKTCIASILEKTTYPNYEIIVVENNSQRAETFSYYDQLRTIPCVQVKTWVGKFNYSAINNWGLQYAKGQYFLLLNNDIEVISADWLQEMLMFCQRKEVGAVGAMLYYPDDTIQHAGVILGLGGVAGHSHKHFPRNNVGYMYRTTIAQNLSAVTGACMMVRRNVWEELKGLDTGFEVAFNDVDFCMRVRKAGYLIVWTPYAELYHHESKSRGFEDTPEKQRRFEQEIQRFRNCWANELAAGDPYYNPNLTLDREDFSVK